MEHGPTTTTILDAQQRVFEKEIEKKQIEDIFSFIINNGALFRYFAEHLPSNLYKVWDEASSDVENKKAVEELGNHYEEFRREIFSAFESLDPESVTAFTDAIEKGDVDGASKILEAYFAIHDEAKEGLVM